MDEDDVVVRELDVYVCNEPFGAQLCLLGHPLRPPWRPYDYYGVENMRYKPNAKRLEVDLPLNTRSPNYQNEEDRAPTEGMPSGSNYKNIDKVTLRSSLVEGKSTIAMGTIQDGKLLLAPVDFCIQLRPHLQHMNISKKSGWLGRAAGLQLGFCLLPAGPLRAHMLVHRAALSFVMPQAACCWHLATEQQRLTAQQQEQEQEQGVERRQSTAARGAGADRAAAVFVAGCCRGSMQQRTQQGCNRCCDVATVMRIRTAMHR